MDHGFLEHQLADLVRVDWFTGKLYEIYDIVHREGYAAKHMLGVFRSDYIIDKSSCLKQMDYNVISVAFAGLASNVSNLHRYVVKNYLSLTEAAVDSALPQNTSADDVAQALVDAHSIYAMNDAAILMVIEDNVTNIMDQKLIEWKTKAKWHKIGRAHV